jgi:hypothetical protein
MRKKLSLKKRIKLTAQLIILLASMVFFVHIANVEGDSQSSITRQQAADIVTLDILKPKTLSEDVVVFLSQTPLVAGQTIETFFQEPNDANSFPITTNSWFAWINDDPLAEFSHETRYVFIDSLSGQYQVFTATSWPVVLPGDSNEPSGIVLWDEQADWEGAADVIFSTIHIE